jgi:hypothetical protein
VIAALQTGKLVEKTAPLLRQPRRPPNRPKSKTLTQHVFFIRKLHAGRLRHRTNKSRQSHNLWNACEGIAPSLRDDLNGPNGAEGDGYGPRRVEQRPRRNAQQHHQHYRWPGSYWAVSAKVEKSQGVHLFVIYYEPILKRLFPISK